MARAKRDIIAEFYDTLEEMGEYCAFDVGRYRADMASPEWTRFRHQEYDGAKAFAEIIRRRLNIEVDIATSPNPPSLWTLIVACVRLFIDAFRRARPMRWRRADANWRPSKTPSPPAAMAWSLFTREESQELARMARSHGVSLQAWLLWSLKEAVASELVPGSGVLVWYVPVSLHGAFPSTEKGNGNFSLEVRFPLEATPDDVYKAIRREQRLRRHWVIAKVTYASSRFLPRWAVRAVVRLGWRQPPTQGSFSSSGRLGEPIDNFDEWFVGLNPVVRTSPLGACCVEWLGLTSLSLQIHPSLANDPQVARDWMASWRRVAVGAGAASSPPALSAAS